MTSRQTYTLMCVLLLTMIVGLYSPAVLSSDMTVRVVLYDDTEDRPLHPRAEIWARGLGSWWLARDNMQDIGGRAPGKLDQLVIYPDSRDGKEITVQFQLTENMCRQGCPRDMITVAIDDNNVTIEGYPVKQANGKIEVVFSRR